MQANSQQTTADAFSPEQAQTLTAKRGILLTIWLIVLAFLFVFTVIASVSFGVISYLYLVSGIAGIFGVAGSWFLKKWGYYVLMALFALSLASTLFGPNYQMVSLTLVLNALANIIILYLVVRGRWHFFD